MARPFRRVRRTTAAHDIENDVLIEHWLGGWL
jgi:hypothetical protein